MKSRSSIILLTAVAFGAVFCCSAQNYSISTFAGQGLFLGDGGPPLSARFGSVSAVALGPDGSLYIADSAYHQVRKITRSLRRYFKRRRAVGHDVQFMRRTGLGR